MSPGSLHLLAAVDLLVLAVAFYLLATVLRQYHVVERVGMSTGVSVLVFGLLVLSLLLIADFMTVNVLQLLLGNRLESGTARVLHEDWRRYGVLAAAGVLLVGFMYLVRVLFPKLATSVEMLEQTRQQLSSELAARRKIEQELRNSHEGLERRVRQRTSALECANRRLQREVADRNRMEAALRESEERFRNLVEGSLQGTLVHRRLRPLFVNPALAHMLGYASPEEVVALGSTERFIAPHERERLRQYSERRLRGDEVPQEYEFDALRKDGSVITVRNMVRVISWQGQPAVQATLIDLTQSKRNELALRESEKRFRDFAAAASDYFWEMDAGLRFSYFSERFTEITGVPQERLLGRTREQTGIPGVDPKAWQRHLEDLRAHRPFRDFVHPRTLSDGRTVWVSINGVPIFDADGEFAGYRGVGRDITRQREAEEALRSSEERFRDFAETAADWFWELDAELRFTYVSGRYREVMGLSPGELLGCSVAEYAERGVGNSEGWGALMEALAARRPFQDLEYVWCRPDGACRYVRSSGRPIFDADGGFRGYRGAARDITEAYELSQQLAYHATHDLVTGLINRREFERRLRELMDSTRSGDARHALCYLDLDQFKVINDTCGHVAGDELLRQLGALLQEKVRKQDTLARLGGDEFGVLLEHCDVSAAQRVATGLREAILDYRFGWEDKTFGVGASIGLVPVDHTSRSITEVLRQADAACYTAKDQGRNRIHVYQEDDVELAQRHGEMQWVSRINRAFDEGRFRLYRQPIVPVNGQEEGEHFELLLRMEDEQGGEVPPGAFLPAAERYNLAVKIDRWVVDKAFTWLEYEPGRLERLGLCCINLSPQSLGDEEFLALLEHRFGQTRVPAEKICFEITETGAIANLSSVTGFLKRMRALGCRFALDDFGSGLSSYAYLRSLPVDFLKIDGTFVKDMVEDPVDLAMVRSINDIGRVMGKKTVAEFVETEATLTRLRELGVDYAQGFALGVPRPVEEHEPAPADAKGGAVRFRVVDGGKVG